jgi:dipeptidyl-peptidase-3
MQYVDQQQVEDIQYITFLLMARAGIQALQYYDPATQKHGQAHMQARQVLVYPTYIYTAILITPQ